MTVLSNKKIIGLVIILMVVTIAVFWYVGYQNRKANEEKEQKYLAEFLAKKSNLEKIAVTDLASNSGETNPVLLPLPANSKLNIVNKTGTSTWQKYVSDLAQALSPLGLKRENEIKNVISAIDNNDATPVKAIAQSRIYFDEAVTNTATMEIPKILEKPHQELLANLKIIDGLLKNMERALSEPTLALNSSNLLAEKQKALLESLDKINANLLDQGFIAPEGSQIKIFLSFN